jgi:hypothetical protein
VASGPLASEGRLVNGNTASDYSQSDDRSRQLAAAPSADALADLATPRLSPLASLIVLSLLSLGIWMAIWALLGSLLSG